MDSSDTRNCSAKTAPKSRLPVRRPEQHVQGSRAVTDNSSVGVPTDPGAEKKKKNNNNSNSTKTKKEATNHQQQSRVAVSEDRPKSRQRPATATARLYQSTTAASRARASPRAVKKANKPDCSDVSSPPGSPTGDLFLKSHCDFLSKDGRLSSRILKEARKSGQINLSNQDLKDLPEEIWNINASSQEFTSGAETPDFNISLDEKDAWWAQKPLNKLIASGNCLTALSEKICQLSCLAVLDLGHNKVAVLPDSMVQCTRLQRLILSHNCLKRLPDKLCNLNDLRLLKVDHNELTCLPAEIGNLYYLEEVDVCHNQLEYLPETLNGWRVRKLNVGKNCLVDLPKEVGWLQSLQTLDLSDNQISILPGEIGELRKLEFLNLTGNQIQELPVLEECLALKELYLGNNRIKDFPDEFFDRIPAIKVLDVHGNRLQNVPIAITKAVFLERLNLAENDLFSILPELALITTLKSLIIDGNPVRTIRKDILKRGTADLLKYLRSRIINIEEIDKENEEDSLFHSIGSPRPHDAIRTKSLDLSGRNLSSIPDSFLEPLAGKDVQIVDLSGNQLTGLPAKLLTIAESVSVINLGKNKLECLDSSLLVNFRYLSSLDVSSNLLRALSSSLGQCTELRELVIASNRFTEIPDAVYQLKKLEVLIANNNKISEIDTNQLMKLEVLIVLDVSNNEIASLPAELGKMSLRSLKVDGNCFKVPRAQILAKGTQEILKYLRNRLPDSIPE